MSNSLAIATVSAALRRLIQGAVAGDVSGVSVTTNRPDSLNNPTGDAGVNIYLYQTTLNPHLRNADQPVRASDGRLLNRPQSALDLHYLITLTGDETQLVPQRLLGAVVRTLNKSPILSRKLIRETVEDPAFEYLKDSDLEHQVEQVKILPQSLNLEELSKLWSVFFQSRYLLTTAYQATVVLVESEEIPARALPVRSWRLGTELSRPPAIERIRVQKEGSTEEEPPHVPITLGRTLVITGTGLRGADSDPALGTWVRLGEVELPVSQASARRILLPLRAPELSDEQLAALQAGLLSVQVLHMRQENGERRPVSESNSEPIRLRPQLTSMPMSLEAGGQPGVQLRVQPPLGRRQRAMLLLNQLLPDGSDDQVPRSYAFYVPPRAEDSEVFRVPAPGLVQGDYLVRLQVDGVESPLSVDEKGRYASPQVTIL